MRGENPKPIDFFAFETEWTKQHNVLLAKPEGDPVAVAGEVYQKIR